MNPTLLTKLLGSIAADNLVVFCGAGLSMAAPSKVPSARTVADTTSQKYVSVTGATLPAGANADLEILSDFSLGRGELRKLMLKRLIEWHPFVRDPNPGHFAVADFLGAKIIQFGISTNFDVLVEQAAENLGESKFDAALDGNDAAQVRPHQPFLKIHGCCRLEVDETLWCKQQLLEPKISARITASKAWLQTQLRGKDLLFVGFWSDWDYLNHVIEDCVVRTDPALVVLIDPMDAAGLQAKAPKLWAWANNGRCQFYHERASGADFLDELRKEYSIKLLEQLLAASAAVFTAQTGNPPPAFSFDRSKTSTDFYSMRRDFEGVPGNRIARDKRHSPHSGLLGAIHLRLLAKGATLSEPRFLLAGDRIRLVQGAGRVLSLVKKDFASEPPPSPPDQIVICAGADDDGGVPSHIVRGASTASVVRPTGGGANWITGQMAQTTLGI